MNLFAGEITASGAQTSVKLDGGGTAVSDVPTQSGDKGRAVNIGVRLEDLVASDGPAIFTGTVNITELLGELTQIYFVAEAGASPVIAKLPGIVRDLRGKQVRLSADPAKVHLFADGKSLRYR